MKNLILPILLLGLFSYSCKDDEPKDPIVQNESIYFPPTSGQWETSNASDLGWDESKLQDLYDLLTLNDSRAFLVLKDGKIVIEKYWGTKIVGTDPFDVNSQWYWASAAKTLTAFMVGKAQEDGFLNVQDKTSDYLGSGWTSLSSTQEDKITVWNQLTMTSGLDDGMGNPDEHIPSALIYKAEAGSRWAYHNGPYTLLDTVVESAANKSFEAYFDEALGNKIGLDGFWSWVGHNHLYFSSARSMARYGWLMMNDGNWDGEQLISKNYVNEMTTKSQEINKSYGYLWWLNGQDSHMLPSTQIVFPGAAVPQAPEDMYAALGKNGQYLCVVPSENLIVIRMGDNPDNALVPLLFIKDIWDALNPVIGR